MEGEHLAQHVDEDGGDEDAATEAEDDAWGTLLCLHEQGILVTVSIRKRLF